MMMMTRTHLPLALALVMITSLPAFAGPPSPPAPPAPPAAPLPREQMRERVQQKIKTFLTVELATRLTLDQKKSLKLSDAISAHMTRKQERQKALKEEMQKLRGMVDSKAPDAQLKRQLDVVLGASSKDDDVQAFVADTGKFLTVHEQAKLALAMPDILKDVHKMMREARREARQGPRGGFGGKADDSEED